MRNRKRNWQATRARFFHAWFRAAWGCQGIPSFQSWRKSTERNTYNDDQIDLGFACHDHLLPKAHASMKPISLSFRFWSIRIVSLTSPVRGSPALLYSLFKCQKHFRCCSLFQKIPQQQQRTVHFLWHLLNVLFTSETLALCFNFDYCRKHFPQT